MMAMVSYSHYCNAQQYPVHRHKMCSPTLHQQFSTLQASSATKSGWEIPYFWFVNGEVLVHGL